MFRARQQGPKHLALGCSWCHWKGLKRRYRKWPRIGHSDICRPSYGQKKGRESNWQFKSRESTSARCPIRECDTSLERSRRGLQLRFRPRCDPRSGRGAMTSQSPGSPKPRYLVGFRDSNLGVPGKRATWMWVRRSVVEYTTWGMVVASPESGPW
jgi:hypothetical protein